MCGHCVWSKGLLGLPGLTRYGHQECCHHWGKVCAPPVGLTGTETAGKVLWLLATCTGTFCIVGNECCVVTRHNQGGRAADHCDLPVPFSPHPPQRLPPCALPSLLCWCRVLVPPVGHVEVCWTTGAHKVSLVTAACVHVSACVLAVSTWAACWLKSTTHWRVAVHTSVKPHNKMLWWSEGLGAHRTWRVWPFVLGQPHMPVCTPPLLLLLWASGP
jgi:hypothetical protein